jgi:hypothetical protein
MKNKKQPNPRRKNGLFRGALKAVEIEASSFTIDASFLGALKLVLWD